MAWVTARNGNVFEIQTVALARKFEADGHKVTETDPTAKPKPKPKQAARPSAD